LVITRGVKNLPQVITFIEAFINELNTNGCVRVGKFKFSALETQKVDLTEYATKEEVGDIETALDHIIAIQNEMIGGDSV
jgi:hypothetical protein